MRLTELERKRREIEAAQTLLDDAYAASVEKGWESMEHVRFCRLWDEMQILMAQRRLMAGRA